MRYLSHPLYLDAGELRLLFEKLGPSLGLWRAAEIAALREQFFPEPVLDLGCGDGFVMARVLSRITVGLDPDRPALKRAARLGIYERFEPTTMEQANLPENGFGTVVSNSVLEHITHIDAALAAAARILRPGGKLIFTAPTEAFSHWLAFPTAAYAARRNQHFEHLNLWTVAEWEQRLARVGLVIECVRPYMRKSWVRHWDWLELLQMVWWGKKRLFGQIWRRLPRGWLDRLAQSASSWDFSAPPPGGGRLITTRKIDYT